MREYSVTLVLEQILLYLFLLQIFFSFFVCVHTVCRFDVGFLSFSVLKLTLHASGRGTAESFLALAKSKGETLNGGGHLGN